MFVRNSVYGENATISHHINGNPIASCPQLYINHRGYPKIVLRNSLLWSDIHLSKMINQRVMSTVGLTDTSTR